MLRALLLGDARTVYDDAEASLKLFTPDIVAATNNIGIHWPGRLDYWVTLHPKKCPDWVGIEAALKQRLAADRNRPQTWCHSKQTGCDRSTEDWSGSTGLLAVRVLLEEGATHIVCAGMPMNIDGGHFYNQRGWIHAHRYHAGWKRNLVRIKARTRSMSGWTQELLGAPTLEWLATE